MRCASVQTLPLCSPRVPSTYYAQLCSLCLPCAGLAAVNTRTGRHPSAWAPGVCCLTFKAGPKFTCSLKKSEVIASPSSPAPGEAQGEQVGPLFGGTVLPVAEGPEGTNPWRGFWSPPVSVDAVVPTHQFLPMTRGRDSPQVRRGWAVAGV